jgi:hypothetical protein
MAQRVEQSTDREGLRPTRSWAWRRRATTFLGVSAVTAVLVACGNTSIPTPSSSASNRPTDVPAPKQWVIKVGDLPQGWRESNPPAGDFRVTLCGVDLEPVLAVRAGAWRWSKSAVGPFLEQQVRVYRDDQAHEVISALKAALPTCTRTEVPKSTNSSEKVTFTITPITVAGAGPDSVAWRQTLVSDHPITSEIVLTRRGRTAVLFNSYTLGSTLDPLVLTRAVAALQATPS